MIPQKSPEIKNNNKVLLHKANSISVGLIGKLPNAFSESTRIKMNEHNTRTVGQRKTSRVSNESMEYHEGSFQKGTDLNCPVS